MNRFEQRSRDSYNQKAADYDNSPEGRYTVSFQAMLRARVSVPQSGALLDVACGNGSLLQKLSAKHAFTGYGVDISENMITCAEKRNPSMTFAVAGCDKLPFGAATFDVLTVCAAFHHFPDPRAFAAESARVLKPGGRLYLADVYYCAAIRVLCNPFVPLSSAGDVKFYAPQEIKRIFEDAGFLQEDFEIEGHVQLVVFRKQLSEPNMRP